MAQFDVYRIAGHGDALDCQADLLAGLPTRFTVPLQPLADAPIGMSRFNPQFDVAGERVMMLTEFAGAVPRRDLRDKVGSMAEHEYAIKAALDMLISGV